ARRWPRRSTGTASGPRASGAPFGRRYPKTSSKRGPRMPRIGRVNSVNANPLSPGVLNGKRALVTGSSRGNGADTAKYFAGAGASVVINYRNKEKRAQQLVDQIQDAGGTAIAVGADLTDPDSVAAMFDAVREAWGGLDILVLNASGGMESGMG